MRLIPFVMSLTTVLVCSYSGIAKPSNESLEKARPVVAELLADDIAAVKTGKKSAESVGDVAISFIASAETDAAKYLLVKEAMALYIRGKSYDKAADAVEALIKAIPDMSPTEIVDLIKNSARGVRGKDAPRLLAILRTNQSQVSANKEIETIRNALVAKPDDATLRRKFVELNAIADNWKAVTDVLARLGEREKRVAEAETGRKNLSLAADFWWDYKPVVNDAGLAIKKHAAELYSNCIESGELSGLRKTLAEKRINQIHGAVGPVSVSHKKAIVTSNKDRLYMCIDLSGGPNAAKYPVKYFGVIPSCGWTEEYKTTKLVLRKVSRGSFTMGSPKNEPKRESESWMGKETQHKVTFTKDFYLGIFPVTQKQWELVMGSNPSHFNAVSDASMCPVEKISYAMIRGANQGCAVPIDGRVDPGSFIYNLRKRTGVKTFDLPTESQWEYVCRAGTTTCTYNGKFEQKLTDAISWSKSNAMNSTHAVGNKKANLWGFYDMLGNVLEFTCDRVEIKDDDWSVTAVRDPIRCVTNGYISTRGGSWFCWQNNVRSACRVIVPGTDVRSSRYGFRLSAIVP